MEELGKSLKEHIESVSRLKEYALKDDKNFFDGEIHAYSVILSEIKEIQGKEKRKC